MKTALIIGISGNFGGQMARTLSKNGWQIKTLMRDASKAPDWLASANIFTGSAQDESAVDQAAQGAELIVYAANPPYHKWHQEAMKMLEPTIRVAEKRGLRILFPGNVYSYAPQPTAIKESVTVKAPTDKGEIRVQMEERLKQASQNGASVTIIRAGDFFGPDMHLSWLKMILKKGKKGYSYSAPHDPQHVHFWSYLPDLCANAVKLVENPESNFDIWHDKGFALTLEDWRKAFSASGIALQIKKFPWPIFRILSLFSPMLREVIKMKYLWETNVVLDGTKLKNKLGKDLNSTALNEIVPLLANNLA